MAVSCRRDNLVPAAVIQRHIPESLTVLEKCNLDRPRIDAQWHYISASFLQLTVRTSHVSIPSGDSCPLVTRGRTEMTAGQRREISAFTRKLQRGQKLILETYLPQSIRNWSSKWRLEFRWRTNSQAGGGGDMVKGLTRASCWTRAWIRLTRLREQVKRERRK